MNDNKQVPEWMQAYGEQLRRDMLEDQARFIRALDKAFIDIKKFYERTKLPEE